MREGAPMLESRNLSARARKKHNNPRAAVDTAVLKRSVVVANLKTSVSLEDAFWSALKEIAVLREVNLSSLITSISDEHRQGNLSSSIRLFILDFYRAQINKRVIPPTQGSQVSNTTQPRQD
jgi:predicted DNA-binding ribbon-helix-helix protein